MRHCVVVVSGLLVACAFDATGNGTPNETIGSTGMPPLDTSSSGVTPSDGTTLGSIGDGSSESTSAGQAPSESTTSPADSTGDDGSSSSTSGTTGAPPVTPWCDSTLPDLAACYPFTDLAGGVLVDEAAAGNDGTIAGIGIEDGPLGEAAVFSADSQLSVPAAAATDLPSALTIELFLRIDAIPRAGRAGVVDRDGQWSLFVFADGRLRCGSSAFTFGDAPMLGQWAHVGCVIGDGYVRLYLDGAFVSEVATANAIATGSPNPLAIGDNSPGFDEPLVGAVSGVRIWSATRTVEELCEGAGDLCGD